MAPSTPTMTPAIWGRVRPLRGDGVGDEVDVASDRRELPVPPLSWAWLTPLRAIPMSLTDSTIGIGSPCLSVSSHERHQTRMETNENERARRPATDCDAPPMKAIGESKARTLC